MPGFVFKKVKLVSFLNLVHLLTYDTADQVVRAGYVFLLLLVLVVIQLLELLPKKLWNFH